MTITAVEGGYTSISTQPVGRQTSTANDGPQPQRDPSRPDTWRGLLVGVTGTRGAGASLLAMGLAAELAGDASNRGLVLLADLAPGGGQGLLRSCPAMVAKAQVRGEEELEDLLGAYRFIVADVEADVGRVLSTQPAGVADVAGLAEATLRRADLIIVVGDASSLCSLAQNIEVATAQAGTERILPVVNRLPRGFKRRSAVAAKAVRLLAGSGALASGDPVFITERSSIRRASRDGLAPPSSPFRPLAAEVRTRLATASRTLSVDD